MLDFFQTIIDGLGTLFSFLGNIITGFLQLLAMLPQVFVFVTSSTAFIPTFLVTFFVASIAISVTLVIIGRKS